MMLPISTERLFITEFTEDMAESVHLNSLDEDNRRFIPDEVFETVEDAQECLKALIGNYSKDNAALVYPIFLKNGEHIGHVQIYPSADGWEVGYHVAKRYSGKGYATEALKAFLIPALRHLDIHTVWGVCHEENKASQRIMEKCGFKIKYEGPGVLHGKEVSVRAYRFQRI